MKISADRTALVLLALAAFMPERHASAQTADTVIINGLAEHGIRLTGRANEWSPSIPVGSDQLGDFGWGPQYEHSYPTECDVGVVPAAQSRSVAAQLAGSYSRT